MPSTAGRHEVLNGKIAGVSMTQLQNGVVGGEHRDDENAEKNGNKELGVSNATTVADVRAALSQLHDREARVTARLDALVASQKDLNHELGSLDILRARLGSQTSAARTISHGMLSSAASTASYISGAVTKLDLEQSRVKSTLEMVGQVSELKACVLGVAGSMGASQDWELAASYMNRALKIPVEITNSAFAAQIVPTAEVPDPPAVTLENAADSLCALFLREFDNAAKENDGTKVTRYFKLFPLIGRSEVGLDVYGRYVCQGVASRARSNLKAGTSGAQAKDGFFYANAMTKLFEHIAQLIEGHGGLVERHYGSGKMARVAERLQVEADVQGGIILESWTEDRQIGRKLTDIKSYAFTFLVQSFLPAPRGGGAGQRSNSPANREAASQRTSEEDSVDMKEIDGILSEGSIMLGRWSLYGKFLGNKCKAENSSDEYELPSFLTQSSLNQKIDMKLLSPFTVMTTFFLRRSVEKAFELDEAPIDLTLNLQRPFSSNPPHITSAVDDIMYIVNKVLEQTLATGQRSVVTNVVPSIARVLGAEFIGMIQRKMRDETYPKPLVPGGTPPENTVVSFLVLINNLDIAVDYVKRIVERHIDSSSSEEGAVTTSRIAALFPLRDDAAVVLSTLKSLMSTFESKAQDLIGDGIQVVFNNVLSSRLRPILSDALRDIEYEPRGGNGRTDDVYEEHDGEGDTSTNINMVRDRFTMGWRELLLPIARILTGRSFDRLVGVTVASLSRLLEKRIWSYHGRVNALGTTRLERDVTGIISAAVDVAAPGGNSSSSSRYRHREAFGRCTQIVMILGLEKEEWEEMSRSGGEAADRLSQEEQQRARAMIVPL